MCHGEYELEIGLAVAVVVLVVGGYLVGAKWTNVIEHTPSYERGVAIEAVRRIDELFGVISPTRWRVANTLTEEAFIVAVIWRQIRSL